MSAGKGGSKMIKRYLLPTLVLLNLGTGSVSLADDICPQSNYASGYWLKDWEIACDQETKDNVWDALAFWLWQGPHYIVSESSLGGSPTITLTSHQSTRSSSGLSFISTHGIGGGFGGEWYSTRNAAVAAATDYLNDGTYAYGEVGFGSNPDSTGWTVTLRPSGIANHFQNNDPNAALFLLYCESVVQAGRDAWSAASKVGTEYCPTVSGCDIFSQLFHRLGCGSHPFYGHQLDDAIRGSEGVWWLYGQKKWQMACGFSCWNPAARFFEVGAFDGTVWGVVDAWNSEKVEIVGFRSFGDWPDGGEVLRVVDSSGDGKRLVVESGLDTGTYRLFRFTERGKDGKEIWSDGFVPTRKPEGWETFVSGWEPNPRIAPVQAQVPSWQEVWLGAGELVFDPPSRADGVFSVSANDGAHGWSEVAVYSSDPDLLVAEWSELIQRGWVARAALGNGTSADAAEWAEWVYTDNMDCFQAGTCPELTVPVLAIVGDPNPGSYTGNSSFFTMGGFPDSDDRCYPNPGETGPCHDLGMAADFQGDALEDIPVYLLPANFEQDIYNISFGARRYEGTWGTNSPFRALFLYGDQLSGDPYGFAQEGLLDFHNVLVANGLTTLEMLASDYPSGSARETALKNEVNLGATMILGMGPTSSEKTWPGSWLTDYIPGAPYAWADSFTTPQSMVVLMPSCSVAGQVSSGYSIIESGMFGDPTQSTNVVFAIGHLNGGWDFQHELFAEILADTYMDSDPETSWPHILWEAKKRAAIQHPVIFDFVRSVGGLGTMVRKQETTVVGVPATPPVTLRLALRILGNPSSRPKLELSLPQRDDVRVRIFDVQGRLVADLFSGLVTDERKQITWNGRDRSGRSVSPGIYFARVDTEKSGVARARIVVIR